MSFTRSFHFSILHLHVVSVKTTVDFLKDMESLSSATLYDNVELALVASCTHLDSHFLPNQNKTFN